MLEQEINTQKLMLISQSDTCIKFPSVIEMCKLFDFKSVWQYWKKLSKCMWLLVLVD